MVGRSQRSLEKMAISALLLRLRKLDGIMLRSRETFHWLCRRSAMVGEEPDGMETAKLGTSETSLTLQQNYLMGG